MRTSVGILLNELVSSTQRLSRIAVGDSSSPALWRTLEVLQDSSPKRLGALATIVRVTQPTMTGIIAGLVKSGWAVRVTDPSDARAQLVDITPDGGDAIDEWRSKSATAMEPYFENLSDEEYDVLARAVDIVASVTSDAQPVGNR